MKIRYRMKNFLPRTTLHSVFITVNATELRTQILLTTFTLQSAPFHQPLTAPAKAYRNCADSSDRKGL